jgi:hypothetical protein
MVRGLIDPVAVLSHLPGMNSRLLFPHLGQLLGKGRPLAPTHLELVVTMLFDTTLKEFAQWCLTPTER